MWIGALVGAFIGIVSLLAGLWQWFGETTVTAGVGELRIHSKCLGLSRARTVRLNEIRGFAIEPAMQRGTEVWYYVFVQLRGGGRTNAGSGMDKTEAEWFVAEIRKDLGIA
jgi:hypothetical protein